MSDGELFPSITDFFFVTEMIYLLTARFTAPRQLMAVETTQWKAKNTITNFEKGKEKKRYKYSFPLRLPCNYSLQETQQSQLIQVLGMVYSWVTTLITGAGRPDSGCS